MIKTVCDICGKEMRSSKYGNAIRNINFCISSNGKIWDMCADCRADFNRWMAIRKAESEEIETWNGIHAQITAPKGTFELIFNDADDDNDI